MARSGVITFKGSPMTLLGEELKVGSSLPEFTLHYFEGGLKTITPKDLAGKPTIISSVPSLDTGVCAIQTKKFNSELAALDGKVNAVTASRDLSDYQSGDFGQKLGLLIDELKLLTRAVVVADANGKVVYVEIVPEVTSEPNYDAALSALKAIL
jgi:thiol peroxidase